MPCQHRRSLVVAGAAALVIILVLAITLPIVLTGDDQGSSSTTPASSAAGAAAGGADGPDDSSPSTPLPTPPIEATERPSVASSRPTLNPSTAEDPTPEPTMASSSSAPPTFRPTTPNLSPSPTVIPTEPAPPNIKDDAADPGSDATTDTATAVAPESQECEEYSKTFDLCSDNGVPYYHCDKNQDKLGTDIVLLHGSSFTKENWRRKDILDDLCSKVTVVASDLSVSANSEVLMAMLDRLEAAGMVRLPVTIVTPSASGRAIVSWTQGSSEHLEDLPKYVKTWVPVAPYSVLSATEAQMSSLRGLVDILAIHGDGNSAGRDVSERLGDLAGAKVVELEGGHAVYLGSPEDFSDEVLDFLGV